MTPASNRGSIPGVGLTLPLPYYKDDLVTLYHGDCRELLPLMRADAAARHLTHDLYGSGA